MLRPIARHCLPHPLSLYFLPCHSPYVRFEELSGIKRLPGELARERPLPALPLLLVFKTVEMAVQAQYLGQLYFMQAVAVEMFLVEQGVLAV